MARGRAGEHGALGGILGCQSGVWLGVGSPAGGVERASSKAGMRLPQSVEVTGGAGGMGTTKGVFGPQDGNKIPVPAQVQGCRHSSPSAIHVPLFWLFSWFSRGPGLSCSSLRSFPGKMGGST